MRDALRLMAERSPGCFVDGWTNRPSVPLELLPIWNSYLGWLATRDTSPASASAWVDRAHWREDAGSRALVFRVFVELAADREKFADEQEAKPKPEAPSDG